MFKRAYTAAMPDQPAEVVNCLRVRRHLAVRLSARRVFGQQVGLHRGWEGLGVRQ